MIVAGFGFTSSASADSLAQALHATGHGDRLDQLATAADKAVSSVMLDFSREHGTPIASIEPSLLEAMQTKTQSLTSQQMRRTGSVAEAAALAAAGPGARLITPRQISADRLATCAIAIGET
ncbi:MAG: cobalamin biosynthesis protein [Aliishimia sp.]